MYLWSLWCIPLLVVAVMVGCQAPGVQTFNREGGRSVPAACCRIRKAELVIMKESMQAPGFVDAKSVAWMASEHQPLGIKGHSCPVCLLVGVESWPSIMANSHKGLVVHGYKNGTLVIIGSLMVSTAGLEHFGPAEIPVASAKHLVDVQQLLPKITCRPLVGVSQASGWEPSKLWMVNYQKRVI